MLRAALVGFVSVLLPLVATANEPALQERIDSYVQSYVSTQNFSGTILVSRDGAVVFARGYGLSDAAVRRPNVLWTRFHVASMSMQFTAAAVLRLADAGKLSLDASVASIIMDYPGGSAITIRNLLVQNSGIADINDQPDYEALLKSHQTAASLVARFRDLKPVHPAGGTYVREEHSAYNLLALIVEKQTGLSFRDAVQRLVFEPLAMRDSGIDDDDKLKGVAPVAKGYAPLGVFNLQPAEPIHWSAKTGSGSAYSTVIDEQKWVSSFSSGHFLSEANRAALLNLSSRAGYGWFKTNSVRFSEPLYYMNGRAPGFASAIVYLPQERLSIVVLSNIYASVTSDIGSDIAALALGRPVQSPTIRTTPLTPEALTGLDGSAFGFPADFYQPSATLKLNVKGADVTLLWPNGDVSALVPVSADHFIDRGYWVPVEVLRDPAGRVSGLKFDHFVGVRAANSTSDAAGIHTCSARCILSRTLARFVQTKTTELH